MKKRELILCAGISLLSINAFASDPSAGNAPTETTSNAAAKDSAASPTSRIRIFGQNGATASLFKGMDCVKSAWSSEAEVVSGGFGSAFSSFIGAASNVSIGIAETETTKFLSQRDGILSKAYYREYEIPAGKPTSLNLGFRNPGNFYKANGLRYWYGGESCNGAISFTPKTGEDYEVGFDLKDRQCVLSVNQVVSKDGATELVPVSISTAPSCSS